MLNECGFCLGGGEVRRSSELAFSTCQVCSGRGQFIGRSLLLPVPSVKGLVFSPKGSQVCYAPIVWEEEKRLIAEFTA